MLFDFTDSCEEKGIGIMPIFWNGNFIEDYTEAGEEEWKKKRSYAEAIIRLLKPKKGLLMWDVFNEPFCNTYLGSASPEDYPRKKEKLTKDLRKHCELIRELDPDTPITVGHELSSHMDSTSDLVDVLSFHDYMPTRSRMEAAYQTAVQLSEAEGGKPILNTETGCIGRANPYDLELEEDIRLKGGHFTGGDVGHPYILHVNSKFKNTKRHGAGVMPFYMELSIASYPFTPEATILCFSCFENRIDNRITGAMVTTESPMMAFCFVPMLLEIL